MSETLLSSTRKEIEEYRELAPIVNSSTWLAAYAFSLGCAIAALITIKLNHQMSLELPATRSTFLSAMLLFSGMTVQFEFSWLLKIVDDNDWIPISINHNREITYVLGPPMWFVTTIFSNYFGLLNQVLLLFIFSQLLILAGTLIMFPRSLYGLTGFLYRKVRSVAVRVLANYRHLKTVVDVFIP